MSRSTSLHELRALMRQWSGTVRSLPPSDYSQRESAACTSWPPYGTAAGELSEWIALQEGSGVAELVLTTARGVLSKEVRWLIVDPLGETYAPALVRIGEMGPPPGFVNHQGGDIRITPSTAADRDAAAIR